MRPASAMARNRIPRHMEAIMTAPASAIEGVLSASVFWLQLILLFLTISRPFLLWCVHVRVWKTLHMRV